MYLKRIEIAGFKSFAERTVIEFDQGLTAVVGPNGSGKSNITEAIRWVLGEQSAKNLRGGRMPDIIFAGTTVRKPLNRAEVTVVLDNADRFLPLDFSEVSVTRRLHRSGDSEFLINKQSCRLKDIVELFMDSGLGKESFSIISQGKVEAIFNSKPEDRRGIFEEAAGVLKYKQRKHQAEQKLFETEDNLNRVQDIIYELEAQLEPLLLQSETAKEYLQLKEQLTSVDVGVTVKEIEEQKEQWEQKERELQELRLYLTEVGASIGSFEQEVIKLRDKRATIDSTLDHDQQQLLEVTEAYEQTEGQKKVLIERTNNTAKSVEEYETSIHGFSEKITQYEQELAQLEKDQANNQREKAQLVAEERELQKLVETYSKSAKERLEELRGDYVELMQAQANVNNDTKHLEKQYAQESGKNQQAIAKHEQLVLDVENVDTKKQTRSEELEAHRKVLETLRQEFVGTQQEVVQTKKTLTTKEKQMYDAMGILQQAKARQKSLQELQENYAGFYQGVRAVLKAKDQLAGIVGAVAELLSVPKELSLAIETALGGAAQNVIVSDETAGRAAIAFLKQKRSGRATFLPLTTIKPRKLNQNVRDQLKGTAGFIGVASDLVNFDENVAPVMENLLGITILARDLQSANAIAKQVKYQFRVVSLEGDVMNPGGSMTGGATRKGQQGNLFSQAEELESLTVQVAQMNEDLSQREHTVRELKEVVKAKENQLEKVREEGEKARLKEQELKNSWDLLEAESKQLAKEKQAFDYESKELHHFLDDYEEQMLRLKKEKERIDEAQRELDSEMSHADEMEVVNRQKKEDAQEKLKKNQSLSAVVTERTSHVTQLLQDKQQQLDETKKEQQNVKAQLRLLTEDRTQYAETKESVQEKMTQLQERKETLQQSLVALKEERSIVHRKVAEIDEKLNEANKQQQEGLGKKSTVEVAKSRSEVSMDTALQHLQEEYSLTFEAAKELYPLTIELTEAKSTIRGLKQRIDQLGPVNISAIEQYETIDERYRFLVAQRDDLLEAKESLFDTMNDMDDVVKQKFEEVFYAIREKFRIVFPNMFGGGHADLVLVDPTDLLHTGIEIVAQPPGKKLQSLSLLSGGERALTAIALLFSIIQVRPVPFCVLDEVEAALDEANVARFGQYLSHFEDDTQFIVITHRKGTMEAADVLYGVTMQESGVSRIVSVRLEDVNERGDIETA